MSKRDSYRLYTPCPDSKRAKVKRCIRCSVDFETLDATREWFCNSCRGCVDRNRLSKNAIAKQTVMKRGGKARD